MRGLVFALGLRLAHFFSATVVAILVFFPAATPTSAQIYDFTTIAGLAPGSTDNTNQAARFYSPSGVAFDSSGNLFVADTENHTIRRLAPTGTNWVSTTIAGLSGKPGNIDGTNSEALFNNPLALAVDGGGFVYVADSSNHTIRRLSPMGTNWVSRTIAGLPGVFGSADGTNSGIQMHSPAGLAIDSQTNVYVADSFNNVIRKLTPVGTNWVSSTIAGLAGNIGGADGTNGSVRFYSPSSVALGIDGSLVVADTFNHTVRMLSAQGSNWVSSTIAGLAGSLGSNDGTNNGSRFFAPTGLSIDQSGSIYIADSRNCSIRRLVPVGTNWVSSTIAGLPGNNGSNDGQNSAARFWIPHGIVTDAVGNIYVADTSNNTIRKVSPQGSNWITGTIAGLAGSIGSADGTDNAVRFYGPSGIALDSAQNLYVADSGNSTIRQLSFSGTNWISRTIGGLAGSVGTADGTNSAARFFYPSGLAVDTHTNIYVADTINRTIREITAIGSNWVTRTIAGVAGSTGSADGTNTAALFYAPAGISVDSAGVLYVADSANNNIRRLVPVGTDWVSTTIAGLAGSTGSKDGTNTDSRFTSPAGIAVDVAGNVYVADMNNSTIRKLSPVGTNYVSSTIAGQPGTAGNAEGTNNDSLFYSSAGVGMDGDGNLYVVDEFGFTVRRLSPVGTNWVSSTIGGIAARFGSSDGTNSAARFYDPYGLAVDAQGDVFVADSGNNSIRQGTRATGSRLAPVFQTIAQNNGLIIFSWNAQTGLSYQVQFNSIPQVANWTNIGAKILATNNIIFSTDSLGSDGHRFYRVVLLPN